MKIKRIIIICASLLIAFSVFQMISAQSLAENEWYIKSKEYLAKAEEAFAQGDYDKGNEYAKQAEEYAQKAEDEGNKLLIKYKASASRQEAEAYLNKAKDLGADTNPETKDLFSMASTEYNDGKDQLDKAAGGQVDVSESQPLLTQAIAFQKRHCRDPGYCGHRQADAGYQAGSAEPAGQGVYHGRRRQ